MHQQPPGLAGQGCYHWVLVCNSIDEGEGPLWAELPSESQWIRSRGLPFRRLSWEHGPGNTFSHQFHLISLNLFSILGFVSLEPLATFLCCDWRKETKEAAEHFAVLKAQSRNVLVTECVLCILNCPDPKHSKIFNCLGSHPQYKLTFHKSGVDYTGLNYHSINSEFDFV